MRKARTKKQSRELKDQLTKFQDERAELRAKMVQGIATLSHGEMEDLVNRVRSINKEIDKLLRFVNRDTCAK